MNKWDKVFWFLFVLLEFAVIVGNLWFFSAVGVILGFAVVALGFAKVGDYVFHKRTRMDMRENRETIRKMRNWLDRQYELTKGIKDIHEHRFHRLDRKEMEIDEKVEKKYRELAGKIIDLENRLNLVSRAVISQRPPNIVRKTESLFESVWKDIINLAKKKRSISTLSRGVKNKILTVKSDRIMLMSDLTKKERVIMKDEFRHFWNVLKRKKKFNFIKDIEDPAMVRLGSIIVSFLARLPYVEHNIKPRVLHLMSSNTHNIGTLKLYTKTI